MAIPEFVEKMAEDLLDHLPLLNFGKSSGGGSPKPPNRQNRPNYTVICTVGSLDLSLRLHKISMVNSIVSVYPCFFLEFRISSKDLVLDKLYGHEDMILKISVADDAGNIREETQYELLIIDIRSSMTSKETQGPTQPNEDIVKMVGIVKKPFEMMMTPINLISEPMSKGTGSSDNKPGILPNDFGGLDGLLGNFVNGFAQNLGGDLLSRFNMPQLLQNITMPPQGLSTFGSAAQDMLGNFSNSLGGDLMSGGNNPLSQLFSGGGGGGMGGNGGGGKRPYDLAVKVFEDHIKDIKLQAIASNANEDSLEFATIPPRTFCGAIRYIDDVYGIFNGPMYHHCRWEDNTYCLWDLSKATEMPSDYTIEFLAIGDPDADKIIKQTASKDDLFYTFNPLTSMNSGNSNVIQKGSDQTFIKKNLDTFYNVVNSNVAGLSEDAVGDGGKELIYNKILKGRKGIYSRALTGGPKDSSNKNLTGKVAGLISGSAKFSFQLKGVNMPITKLSRVGGNITINPHVLEYSAYQGKYITNASIINLSRDSNFLFQCEAVVFCFRQNFEV